ncbi:MAG TPA: DUF177 domain-containing protein [bacterium]
MLQGTKGEADGMIIPLSHIGPAGLRRTVQMALSGFPRLTEAHGPQPQALTGEVVLKNRNGHVEVTGNMRAQVQMTCSRCLDPVLLEIEEPVQVTLAPDGAGPPAGDEVQLAAEDLDVSFYSGDAIDLAIVLEDELLLLIPDAACDEAEDGTCTCCGKAVDEVLKAAHRDEAFHPLAGLRSLVREPDGKKH